MQAEKTQPIKIELLRCKPECDSNCYPSNRHYPFKGTLELTPQKPAYYNLEFIRLNLMLGPGNRLYESALPSMELPKGYKFHTSVQEGAEWWIRYYWWTGRVPQLAAGDVLQEVYMASCPVDMKIKDPLRITKQSEKYFKTVRIHRNFLILDDSKNCIEMQPLRAIPMDPMMLLRMQEKSAVLL
jgi:hypothetical protein